jgi:DNA-binding NarL/FixJ family response regulator
MKVTILLADDHAVLRHGVIRLLESADDLEVIGEADNGCDAVARAGELKPNVVVIDISMPLMNGIAAMREILKVSPASRVLVLSMHTDERFVYQALQAGARGYVEKGAELSELLDAIRMVASGSVYLSGSITGVVVDGYLRQDAPGPDQGFPNPLSHRETEIVQLLAEGKSTKETAYLLKISARTVDAHRQRIMTKLGIDSVAGLVKWAIRQGLTSEE